MIWIDVAIVLFVAYCGYVGARRGLLLVGLELVSFVVAAVVALALYHPAGAALKSWAGMTTALANVSAFLLIWMLVELTAALIIRFAAVPRLPAKFATTRSSQIGGATLNAAKGAVLLVVGLILFSGLPLSASAKRPVTDSFLAERLLASGGWLQQSIAGGLGRDLGESLTIFTAPISPHDNRRIELGFKTTSGHVDDAAENQMLDLINHERTSRGLSALTINDKARAVARTYSQRMLAEGLFSHIDNDGKSPFDRMRAGGVEFGIAGENLALAPTLQLAHKGLMNSPGHRANILRPAFRTVGIGIIDAGPYGLMVTQNFTD